MTVYMFITAIVLIVYGGTIFWANSLIKAFIVKGLVMPKHWSDRTNSDEFKKLIAQSTDEEIIYRAKKTVLLFTIGKYTVLGGLVAFILCMILGIE